jgi:argininosuccinate lyase
MRIHLEKCGKDSNAVRDARLDHAFSEKRAQREVLFAKGLRHNSRILTAEQYSSIENSMEKTDENFADGHAKIESVFEDCEKTIELLFVEVEN